MEENLIINKKGFSLMEVMVSIFIFAILFSAVYELIIFSTKVTSDNKFYVNALALASQKMERIRNLPYADVGTLTGSPQGVIPDEEIINSEGNYKVNTTIIFYDDPYDGTLEAGTDNVFVDYKIATIDVSWLSKFGEKKVTFISNIIPKTEENLSGYGLLKIIVVDANGNKIPNANIHIENNSTSTPLNGNYVSNISGELSLPVKPSYEQYEVTVTKSEYSIDKTYKREEPNLNPTKPHLTVIEGQKTEESFSIDRTSNLHIKLATQSLPENYQINTDITLENQISPRFDIDSQGNRYTVWKDFRDEISYKLYSQKNNALGLNQWTDDLLISNHDNQLNPDISLGEDNNLYIGWNDNSLGNQDLYLAKISTDGVLAWSEIKINTQSDNSEQTNIKLKTNNNTGNTEVTAIWQDNRNTNLDIFMQRFDSSHNPLLSNEVKVNTNSDSADQYEAVLDIDTNNNIFIAWTDERNSNKDIYAQKYNLNGSAQWPSDLKINTNTDLSDQFSPSIAIDKENNIYISWTDERDGDQNIYMQKFNSNGDILLPSDVKINSNSDISKQSNPNMTIDDEGNVFIIWTDERNGDQDIYAQKYASSTFWTTDLRINIDIGGFSQLNSDLDINPVNKNAVAVWQDDRDLNFDIFQTEFNTIGTIYDVNASVPLIITGTKKIGENPIIYKYDNEYNTNSNGILNLNNIEWDSGYSINIKPSYTAYTIIMTDPITPVELLSGETINEILYLE